VVLKGDQEQLHAFIHSLGTKWW